MSLRLQSRSETGLALSIHHPTPARPAIRRWTRMGYTHPVPGAPCFDRSRRSRIARMRGRGGKRGLRRSERQHLQNPRRRNIFCRQPARSANREIVRRLSSKRRPSRCSAIITATTSPRTKPTTSAAPAWSNAHRPSARTSRNDHCLEFSRTYFLVSVSSLNRAPVAAMIAMVASALRIDFTWSGCMPIPFFHTSRNASSAGIGSNCSAQNSGQV